MSEADKLTANFHKEFDDGSNMSRSALLAETSRLFRPTIHFITCLVLVADTTYP